MQPTNYFKTLNTLFTAFLAGQVIFAAMAGFLVLSGYGAGNFTAFGNIFFIAVPALIIAGRLGGNMLFNSKTRNAQSVPDVQTRLNVYRTAFIIRCALLEGPVLFAIIAFMLTQVIEMMAFVAGGIFLFFLLKPSKEKIATTLNISPEDIS